MRAAERWVCRYRIGIIPICKRYLRVRRREELVLLLRQRSQSVKISEDTEVGVVTALTAESIVTDQETGDPMTDTNVAIDGVLTLQDLALAHAQGRDDAVMTEDAIDREVATQAKIEIEDLKGRDHGRVTGVRPEDREVDLPMSVMIGEGGAEIKTEIVQSQSHRRNLHLY